PAVDALRCGLAPTDALGHRVEHGEVSRMLCHQLAPELGVVLADGLRQLVHEALQEDGVLVDVHATPEPRLDVRIAHGMVDHQVRDRVAERMLRAGRHEALEGQRVFSLSRFCGKTSARMDWPESRMCKAVRLLLASNPPTSLHCMTG